MGLHSGDGGGEVILRTIFKSEIWRLFFGLKGQGKYFWNFALEQVPTIGSCSLALEFFFALNFLLFSLESIVNPSTVVGPVAAPDEG